MTHISKAAAPWFELPGVTFNGLASPSRGARENAAWIVTLAPGTPGNKHRLTREEILVCIEGRAVASLGEQTFALCCGDALIVPADTWFALANPGTLPFRAVAVLPVGGQAMMEDGAAFTPPWAA